ncbi:hypothetical protein FJTKL_14975 [Diaporthe vaccinii]|uniref:Uncharacterized protein n=1 Tax=Diaporthe vaccinii TaxID=105482 RepID=A0ABR4E6F9_9PEZI
MEPEFELHAAVPSPPGRKSRAQKPVCQLSWTVLFLKSRLSHLPFLTTTLLLLHSLFPDLPPFFLLSASAVLLPCRHRLPSASPTCRSLIHLVPINQPNRSGCLRPGRTSIQPTISAVPGSCSGCGIVQQEQLRIRINPVEEKETREGESDLVQGFLPTRLSSTSPVHRSAPPVLEFGLLSLRNGTFTLTSRPREVNYNRLLFSTCVLFTFAEHPHRVFGQPLLILIIRGLLHSTAQHGLYLINRLQSRSFSVVPPFQAT